MSPDPKPLAGGPEPQPPQEPTLGLRKRLIRLLLGKPKSLADASIHHSMSLVPFLAWVGLGADGLSSSSYGPEEAYRTLEEHTYLAVGLALLTALTVLLISAAYSRIIEEFPHGGGGYVVATKLLGERVGVISGCALLVDYMLTITVSIAAAGDALFSFLPIELHFLKLPAQVVVIIGLTGLNMRGIKESVVSMMPIFVLFLVTHVILIGGGIIVRAPEAAATAVKVGHDFSAGLDKLGIGAMLLLFIRAYSLGGGTYTGIEAVSNGLPIMREPRVQTAKRTMVYMALSLSITAAGLFICYLLWHVRPEAGKTLNAVLVESLMRGVPGGHAFVVLTLFTEGALLIVAAQAGFIDGPRVLAGMAVDSWVPRRFAALSERLTTQNGIALMGAASLAALLYTSGDVRYLVVMYSINVFVTFSLSMFGMARAYIQHRKVKKDWFKRAILFSVAFAFCAIILMITIFEKFTEGGWITLAVTTLVILLCYLIKAHYRNTGLKLAKLYQELHAIPLPPVDPNAVLVLQTDKPTAAVLVGNFGGLGLHTFLNIFRTFSGHYKNVIFLTVGIVDSGEFKGEHSIEALDKRSVEMLHKYVEMANRLSLPATFRHATGTDAVAEAEKLCKNIATEFSNVTFFAGKVVFEKELWFQSFLHNDTAFAIQKRLQWQGMTMVIMPARVT
jgi:amino acid transporter